MNSETLKQSVKNYILDPRYPDNNFIVGNKYEEIGQYSSALSFYLRTAELSVDTDLQYESLLRMAMCVRELGNRWYSQKGILLRAISLCPERPEAYYQLCLTCEKTNEWHDVYAYSKITQTIVKDETRRPLLYYFDYPGKYIFEFQQALSAWYIGLFDESMFIFRNLLQNPSVRDVHRNIIENNIRNYGYTWKKELRYDQAMYPYLRYKFPGSKDIEKNHSQCFQDLFVLMCTDGTRKGKYLEFGAGDPVYNSNTYLLEKEFQWEGLSFEIDPEKVKKFKSERKNPVFCEDATKINIIDVLDYDYYDYLQIDCDPALTSFQVLQNIPFGNVSFGVITFEHDNFTDEHKEIKQRSRDYLRSFGYELVVTNIAEDRFSDFEDWWVNPDFIERGIINLLRSIPDHPQKADDYIFNRK